MLVYNIFCDVCDNDNVYSTLASVASEFKTVRLGKYEFHVCNECKTSNSRAQLYKTLNKLYPQLKQRRGILGKQHTHKMLSQ